MMFAGTSLWGFSQSSFVSAGGDNATDKGSISFSVGQISTEYATASVGSVSQGVQVVYDVLTVGIDNYPSVTLMQVYPNPTASGVALRFDDVSQFVPCSAVLYDADGKALQHIEVSENLTYIPMYNYVSGIYYLNVSQNKNILKNFKIIKK